MYINNHTSLLQHLITWWSSITLLGIPGAYMIPGHSGACGPSRSMRVFLGQVNGCGRTQHIHLKRGQYHRSRSQLGVSWIMIRRPSTIIFPRLVRFTTCSDHLAHAYRFVFVSSMQLDYWRADFSPYLSFVSKYTHMKSIFGRLCGSDAVSSSIILFCELRKAEITRGGEKNFTMSGMQGKGLSAETERQMMQKVRTIMNYNRLIIALWVMDRSFGTGSWRNYLTAKQVGLFVVPSFI